MSAPVTTDATPVPDQDIVVTEEKVEKDCDLEALKTFVFDRTLSEGQTSAYLYGTIHGEPAIVHVARTSLDTARAPELLKEGIENLKVFLENRPYFSANAFLQRTPDSLPDLALKLIWPATPVHVKKYTAQPRKILHETPETYRSVVLPYIESFPPERLEWVRAILEGRKEAERVVFRSPSLDKLADSSAAAAGNESGTGEGETVDGQANGDASGDPNQGFVLVPDLKWDGTTVRQLYLTAIVGDSSIRSLRDLTAKHLPLLREIKRQAYASAKEKYGVEHGDLRMFVHYQPSYYHFHVHIVHVAHDMLAGMAVGQAHLLDDVINWLELTPSDPLPARLTFTYSLGVEHGLYAALSQAPENVVHDAAEPVVSAGAEGGEQSASVAAASEPAAKSIGTQGTSATQDAGAAEPSTGIAEPEDAEARETKRRRV